MDGWELEEKGLGHDYIILKLGKPGKISKLMLIHLILMAINHQ